MEYGDVDMNIRSLLPSVSATAVGAYAFNKVFNRDPTRYINPVGMVSASDGKVYSIDNHQIKVVLRIHDVHIIRAPLAGRIKSVVIAPGTTEPCIGSCPPGNRCKIATIDTKHGDVVVKMVHGAVTKKITVFVQPGDTVSKGARIGHIHLGSGCDVSLPPGYTSNVQVGDIVYAGSTIIATRTR
jgi:phosphatidylserine decarboxylase